MFGPLELVDTGERRHHWRLRTSTLRSLVTVSAEELAELNAAAAALDRTGVEERATMLRQLADKLRALLEQDALTHIEPDLQALMVAEGLAMRPGPRPRLDPGLLGLLRDAIKTGQVVAFDYRARATGNVNRREVQPYGIIYGNRAFLVGHTARGSDLHLWRLANISAARITGQPFTRNPAFDLQAFAKRSFGTFQEEPVSVELRFDAQTAQDVTHFIFHPDQTVTANKDGSLTVPAHRRRPRRDLLAPRHLGHPRHHRTARPPPPPHGRPVRHPRHPPRHLNDTRPKRFPNDAAATEHGRCLHDLRP